MQCEREEGSLHKNEHIRRKPERANFKLSVEDQGAGGRGAQVESRMNMFLSEYS